MVLRVHALTYTQTRRCCFEREYITPKQYLGGKSDLPPNTLFDTGRSHSITMRPYSNTAHPCYSVPMTTTRFIIASSSDPAMRYAVPYHVSDPFIYIEQSGTKTVLIGILEYEAMREALAGSDIVVEKLEPYLREAKERAPNAPRDALPIVIAEHFGMLEGEIVVPPSFPLHIADLLRDAGAELRDARPFSPERAVKRAEEIASIEQALGDTCNAFRHIEQVLHEASIDTDGTLHYKDAPLTSERLKREVEHILLDHELLASEGMIIAGGVQSAIPHHEGAGVLRAHEPIICDIFPRHRPSGYFADMTRTYWKGEPSEQYITRYIAVLEAHVRALVTIRPGATGAEVHAACTEAFIERGIETADDTGFIHSTGHGLGIELHEEPNLSPHNTAPLVAGNVVTVEPELYFPGWGGIRIEDVVVVTEDGYRDLTTYPKTLEDSIIM